MQSVVVHGHFYQPPRENPWTGEVVAEPTAAPFHDWNERITHECYEPFAAARILDAAGHVQGRLNLYEWASFDVAPTLMRWLDKKAPQVYGAICAADRSSAGRLGRHGNAIASPYDHIILPLASRRDKVTQVRWGLADFRRRFGRDTEGFWLPETAVDEETLVVLAEAGVRFTIVAPHQVENPVPLGVPLRFAAGGGREIALFVYDGALANDMAFGHVLDDGDEFARRLVPRGPALGAASPGLTSVALDGETFGHHRKFAEMALAGAVVRLGEARDVRVENYASVLARVAPAEDAMLVEPSSWSCVHGVERWRSNCTCGIAPGASHAWRRPLRSALNWLARELDARFAAATEPMAGDPWQLRDAYGDAIALPLDERIAFVKARVRSPADAERVTAMLEGVRARLAMFGSCAWFFDEATGHEVELMLRFAARATEALGADDLTPTLLARLALVGGGAAPEASAADLYRERVLPMRDRGAA